jgi:deoxyribodipyrimidine photolyase
MPALLWFRRDLRLHDLPPMLDAAQADGEVLACYVLDPRLEGSAGPRRLQFLYDSLRELRDGLDGRLLITRGRPEIRIPALVKEIGATSVHVSADFSPFGMRRDAADVGGGVDIPAGAELAPPAGETAARKAWKRFVGSSLDDYADDRDRPDRDGTSRMSAHLKFGTIHPLRVSEL